MMIVLLLAVVCSAKVIPFTAGIFPGDERRGSAGLKKDKRTPRAACCVPLAM